jgi:glycosyltransferase involved in cell wall biosynthesis
MKPLVSIGMPVYNGDDLVGAAIESLLSQDYPDFELIISDNCSTDRTEDICREYLRQDSRVRYVRQTANKGAAANFNCLVQMARGKYFKWAAHDDLCAPRFLSACVRELETDRSIVLCFTRVRCIDKDGSPVGAYHNIWANSADALPEARFADIILLPHACFEVFGVVRSEVLRRTALIGPYMASDRVLLAELALHGRLFEVAEPLFLSRDHPGRSVNLHPHARHVWFDTARAGSMHFPYWRLLGESISCVARSPVTRRAKLQCYRHLLTWAWNSWRLLRGDVRRAPRQLLMQAETLLRDMLEAWCRTPVPPERTATAASAP